MAAELPRPRGGKPRPRLRRSFLPSKRWAAVAPRLLRIFGTACLVASVYVATRQFRLLVAVPDALPPQPHADPDDVDADADDVALGGKRIRTSEASVNLWRRVEHNLPPEKSPPNPKLYGTGSEKCFSLGLPDASKFQLHKGDPAAFWQMNSRAMCYSSRPVCLYGRQLQHLLTFDPRGSGTCDVVAVESGTIIPARKAGLNESCAAWRKRQVAGMYGTEVFTDWDKWNKWREGRKNPDPRHHSLEWASDFAIVVPKFEWSYNICHYNRIWNFIVYVIRNLGLFVPDADKVEKIDILFRSGYKYKELWHAGIRDATLSLLMKETGKKITVGKVRFDYLRDFQCMHRGIILGREGRIDAFPFFNDTPVWKPEQQLDDSHWPVIPHDSLWLREAVMQAYRLPSVGRYTGPGIKDFQSIPLPPRRVGILQRSPRSRRRFTRDGKRWFENTLTELCKKHDMKLEHVRTSSAMNLGEQVKQVNNLGLAVGLHGANMVNTMFMPPAGALFEIFPWRYVRFYYAGGGNSGLRYSFHEPEGGKDRNCSFKEKTCFMKYRESLVLLTERDQERIRARLDKAMGYIAALHRRYPDGEIPLRRVGNVYHFEK